MPRCIPTGTTWLLKATRVWSLLTNDTGRGSETVSSRGGFGRRTNWDL